MTDKHVSATERFTDSGLHTVPWTEELVIKGLELEDPADKAEVAEQFKLAREDGQFNEQAEKVMKAAGYAV